MSSLRRKSVLMNSNEVNIYRIILHINVHFDKILLSLKLLIFSKDQIHSSLKII